MVMRLITFSMIINGLTYINIKPLIMYLIRLGPSYINKKLKFTKINSHREI